MSRGRFIALEGGEGVGKSTQARILRDALETRGIPAVTSREPGGTPGAEAIRALLLAPPGEGWPGEAEALLFAAARADHTARLIVPALDLGRWVVCDRYVDSSRAYQGAAGGLDDAAIRALHDIGSGGLVPDLTLVLQLPADEAQRRLTARDGDKSDAIGGRSSGYHMSVAEAFAAFAREEPSRFAVIDAGGTPEDVAARIWQAVEPLLPC